MILPAPRNFGRHRFNDRKASPVATNAQIAADRFAAATMRDRLSPRKYAGLRSRHYFRAERDAGLFEKIAGPDTIFSGKRVSQLLIELGRDADNRDDRHRLIDAQDSEICDVLDYFLRAHEAHGIEEPSPPELADCFRIPQGSANDAIRWPPAGSSSSPCGRWAAWFVKMDRWPWTGSAAKALRPSRPD